MEFDIRKQKLLIDGKITTASDVREVVEGGLSGLPDYVASVYNFLYEWFDDNDFVTVRTSGSTGMPKEIRVKKSRMMASAAMTCSFFGLERGDNALLCMNLKYIGAKMMVVRSLVCGMNLIVRPATGHPFSDISVHLSLAAVVPMQMFNTMTVPAEAEIAGKTEFIIIGGGAVSSDLQNLVKRLPNAVYSTYGMTETLSHIALRRLNGNDATDCYVPLPGVSLSLSDDNTLQIKAPSLCDSVLKTNDLAELDSNGHFRILGRLDNVINSGGIKVYPEQIEEKLEGVINRPFVITSLPDPKFGEIIVLMVEGKEPLPSEVARALKDILPHYMLPKHIVCVDHIPLTENGKIARAECRKIIQ